MRVLWLCNIVIPELSDVFGFKKNIYGGWLSGVWDELKKRDDIELGICVPIIDASNKKDGVCHGFEYFSFQFLEKKISLAEKEDQTEELGKIIDSFKPDLIHIWGTEYLHAYTMVQACKKRRCLDRVLVHIQGLVSVIAKHYAFGIPEDIVHTETCGIADEIADFEEKGRYETEVIKAVHHISGRTEWDHYWASRLNPTIAYVPCGELLRENFYRNQGAWDVHKCEKHRVFMSQIGYPVKGFHTAVESFGRLYRKYPDLKLYIAGPDIRRQQGTYARYLRQLMEDCGLEEAVIFTGKLQEEEMARQYQLAHVFVSASTIENSSNSVCEAMMIGTPVVASCVGGVASLIDHKKNGFLYPLEEAYMSECYIDKIFQHDKVAEEVSKEAVEISKIRHNKKSITDQIAGMYQEIGKG